jgi:ribose transport system substrate-binding protein
MEDRVITGNAVKVTFSSLSWPSLFSWMQRPAKREKEIWVVGGGGMKEMVKRVIDKDPQTPVNIVYSPTMIGVATELTALHFVTKLPMNGTYIVDSPLVSPENATQYYFPNLPY